MAEVSWPFSGEVESLRRDTVYRGWPWYESGKRAEEQVRTGG